MTAPDTKTPRVSAERVDELISMVENWGTTVESPRVAFLLGAVHPALRELSALQGRVKELERDALRYRWLREQCNPDVGFWWAVCPPAPEAAIRSAAELDEAIDAHLPEHG